MEDKTCYFMDSLVFFVRAITRLAEQDYQDTPKPNNNPYSNPNQETNPNSWQATAEDIMWCRYREYIAQDLHTKSVHVGALC